MVHLSLKQVRGSNAWGPLIQLSDERNNSCNV